MIAIQFNARAQEVLRKLDAIPARMMDALRAALDQENLLTVSHIQKNRLNFPATGPTTMEGLRHITGRLFKSLATTPSQWNGDKLTSSIGTNVKYAAIHEFGGVINRTVKPGVVRLRTDASGNLLRRGNLATFARSKSGYIHKQYVERKFEGGKSYKIVMPERAPIRKGIADRAAQYESHLSNAVINSVEGAA